MKCREFFIMTDLSRNENIVNYAICEFSMMAELSRNENIVNSVILRTSQCTHKSEKDIPKTKIKLYLRRR